MYTCLNPLSPHDALKHHFRSLKTDQNEYSHETGLPIRGNFLYVFNHIKSSSSGTSRELRKQFAACSG